MTAVMTKILRGSITKRDWSNDNIIVLSQAFDLSFPHLSDYKITKNAGTTIAITHT
jgi:hypothetical protein